MRDHDNQRTRQTLIYGSTSLTIHGFRLTQQHGQVIWYRPARRNGTGAQESSEHVDEQRLIRALKNNLIRRMIAKILTVHPAVVENAIRTLKERYRVSTLSSLRIALQTSDSQSG